MEQNTIFLLTLYAVAFFFIIFFRKSEWILICILGFTCIFALYLTNVNIKLLVPLTILFSIVENICVYYGMWKYNTKYNIPLVPVWIYLAWFASIIFIMYLTNQLKTSYKNKEYNINYD
jgi:hypothetical protein